MGVVLNKDLRNFEMQKLMRCFLSGRNFYLNMYRDDITSNKNSIKIIFLIKI